MLKRVLVIDDDIVLGNIITIALQEEDFEVHYQSSLVGLRYIVKEFYPDIVILDIEVGNGDGIENMVDIKLEAPDVPIIIISSHIESVEVKRALQQGAIAYLKKPFEVEELLAYVNRHVISHKHTVCPIGSLTLVLQSKTLFKGNEEIKRLTPLEYKLLKLLIMHKGEIVAIEQFENIWEDHTMNDHTLYNYIGKLRKILSIDDTIALDSAGRGYMLRC